MKTAKYVLAVLLLGFVCIGAMCQQQILTPDKMTVKQRATFAMNLYSNAYDNYLAQFAATPQPITGATKEYFQAYKQMMEVAYPIVTTYSQIAVIGGTPSPEQEQAILTLIYQMQAILMKGMVK
jgi:hypothetical protein